VLQAPQETTSSIGVLAGISSVFFSCHPFFLPLLDLTAEKLSSYFTLASGRKMNMSM
jgi:hypothetical protein